MPSPKSRHDPANPSPQRVTALGGAVAITAMALAGALGVGPGAARSHTTAEQTAAALVAADPAPSQAGTSRSAPSSDGWLTVDQSPAPVRASTSTSVALPANSGSGRRVVYDVSAQRVWLVGSDGTVERTYLVSGSRRETLLDPATYAVYSKSRHAVSFNHKETMGYMVRFAHGDNSAIGFHDIPVHVGDGSPAQSRSDLGTPQSAGCIRQREADAKALWRFARIGTTVVVTA